MTLFGVVATDTEKQAAERTAREVKGVKSVRNELQVVSKARQEKVAAYRQFFEHCYKILKPGGRLVVQTIALRNLSALRP